MAVALSSTCSPSSIATAATASPSYTATTAGGFELTIASGDTIAVVYTCLGYPNGTTTFFNQTATVTIGGVAMTRLPSAGGFGSGGKDGDGYSDIYYLLNPVTAIGSTGAKVIQVTWTFTGGAIDLRGWINGQAFNGALDSTTPITALTPNAANLVTSRTQTATAASGDWVGAQCYNGSSAPTVTTGTRDAFQTGSNNTGAHNCAIAHNTGTGTVSVVFGCDSSDESQSNGFLLKAGASGPPTGTIAVTAGATTSSISGTVANAVTGTIAVTAGATTGAVAAVTPGFKVALGNQVSAASSTTLVITTTAAIAIGDLIVVRVAADNLSATTPTFTCADSGGNTYTTQSQSATQATAASGVAGGLMTAKATVAIAAGGTITVTLSGAVVAKAAYAEAYTSYFANTTRSTPVQATPSASGVITVTSGTVNSGDLVLGWGAYESNGSTAPHDSDTLNGSWTNLTTLVNAAGGTANTRVQIAGECKVTTASGAQTWDSTGPAQDAVGGIVVLQRGPDAVFGQVNATPEGATTSSISGTVGTGTITGTIAVTTALTTSAITGYMAPSGTIAKTYAPTTSTITATQSGTPVSGTIAQTYGATTSAVSGWIGSFPKSISGRRIYDAAGKVWPMKVGVVWGLTQNLSTADITTMLAGLAARHFNAAMFWPCGSSYGVDWDRYHDIDGNPFFTGTAFQSSLGSAWAKVDWAISECARLGLTAIFSFYLGNGTEGFYTEFTAASTTQLRTFGQDVATRYAVYPNIIWHIGLDRTFGDGASSEGTKVDACIRGVNDIEAPNYRLRTSEHKEDFPTTCAEQFFNTGGTDYSYVVPSGVGLTTLWINSIYNHQQNAADAVDAGYAVGSYALWDTEPVYRWSGRYGSTTTIEPQEIREHIYALFFRGGVGADVGNEDRWPCGKSGIFSGGRTWPQTLTDPDAFWAQYAWDLVDSVDWASCSPSGVNVLITSGELTGDDRAACAYSSSLGLIYLPTNRSITADLSKFTTFPSALVRKYDPTAGTYTTIGTFATTSGRVLSAPGTNSTGDGDWVIVIQGVNDVTGTIAVTTGATTSIITGTETISGTLAQTYAATTSAITGTETLTGTIVVTLTPTTSAITGTHTIPSVSGTIAVTYAPTTGAITGTHTIPGVTGTIAVTTGATSSAVTATETISGTIAKTYGATTSAITGTETITGTIAVTVGPTTCLMLSPGLTNGTIVATLGPTTASITGSQTIPGVTGTLAGSYATTAALVGTLTITGTIAVTLAPTTSAITGTHTPQGISGTIAVTYARTTALVTGAETIPGTITALQAGTTAAFSGTVAVPVVGTIARTLGPTTAVILGLGNFLFDLRAHHNGQYRVVHGAMVHHNGVYVVATGTYIHDGTHFVRIF